MNPGLLIGIGCGMAFGLALVRLFRAMRQARQDERERLLRRLYQEHRDYWDPPAA